MKEKQKSKSKILKRTMSLILAFALAAAGMPQTVTEAKAQTTSRAAQVSNPRREEEFSMSARQKVTWDCIYFGRYPQSEITVERDPSLYYRLEQEYWGNGSVTLDGIRYYNIGGKFYGGDPIKWRILSIDGNTALLLSDVALDYKQYHTVRGSITWEKCMMRSWLNGYDAMSNSAGRNYSADNFIDVAFTGAEQTAIRNTAVKNERGNDTIDKLFLLSESETGMTDAAAGYGFVKNQNTYDEARRCQGSAYTKARGLSASTSSSYKENVVWRLRSWAIETNYLCYVDDDGHVGTHYGIYNEAAEAGMF